MYTDSLCLQTSLLRLVMYQLERSHPSHGSSWTCFSLLRYHADLNTRCSRIRPSPPSTPSVGLVMCLFSLRVMYSKCQLVLLTL
jgi:hypothetical protein